MATSSAQSRLRPSGMHAFLIFWFGQLVSLLGTGMSRFALTIWAWEVTGQATALALVGAFSFAPAVIISPVAGVIVDRLPRKLVIIMADVGAGLASLAILLLYTTGNLEIWHLYVAGAFAGTFESFQFPAFSSAISTMLPKSQYARANGLLSLAESVSIIGAPILAGLLLAIIGIGGILLIDIVSFLIGVGLVLIITIPQPKQSAAGRESGGSFWHQIAYGFRYILARPSLLGLQLAFLASNFFSGFGLILVPPMILARTMNNELTLASVQSAMGVGGLVGGLLISTWGGPKRRVHGVLAGFIVSGLAQTVLGTSQALWGWIASSFVLLFVIPIINGSNQAIWQAKVAPDVQGRVFATRRTIAQISGPLGMLLAGPFADHLFEPAMQQGRTLANALGPMFGTGSGAGMGVLIALTGLLSVMAAVVAYALPVIRQAEDRLPDHDEEAETLPPEPGGDLPETLPA